MSKQYLFYPKKGVISDSSASIQLLQPSQNDIIVYQTSTNWFNTGTSQFIKSLNFNFTGTQGVQGPTGNQGPPSSGGGNQISVINSLNTRVLTSDGTSTGVIGNTGLTYNQTRLNVGGNISPTGLFVYSNILNPSLGIINTTKQINLIYNNPSWAAKISGITGDIGNGISVDSFSNSYVTGQIGVTGTVYNSDGTAFTTIFGSGSTECFIVKYGPTGMGIWSTKISGTSTNIGTSITTDNTGNSYVTGIYTNPTTFYNSDGTAFTTITTATTEDCFTVKYGPTGMGQWVSRISSTAGSDNGNGIAVDTNGNSYVTGLFRTPSTVYNSDGTTFRSITGSGTFEIFVIEYGTTGMCQWVSKISGAGDDRGFGIDVDQSGNSYVTGYYLSPSTVYNSDGTAFTTLFGSGGFDCFIAKYGPTGMANWATKISGTISGDIGYGIATDSIGNSYITGQFASPATVYNSDGTAFATIRGSGNSECFVTEYGPTGMCQWVSKISGVGNDIGRSITIDSVGNSYVTGSFTSPATVYNSDGTTYTTLFGSGITDCFIVKYGPTGMGQLATKISGVGSDQGNGISLDSFGNMYVTGQYTTPSTVYNFDGSSLTTIFGSGNTDCFIVKYSSPDIGTGYFNYTLNDLDNNVNNNGKIINVLNPYIISPTINVKNLSNTTYLTTTINKSANYLFYNGKWYLTTSY